jgi:transposase
MKTTTSSVPQAEDKRPTKLGPGEYIPDTAYTRIEDLPKPIVIKEKRIQDIQPCPRCHKPSRREHIYERSLHDIGDLVSGRPRELRIRYSQHYCRACGRAFNIDMTDVAPPASHYTHRVIALAVRLVVEDGIAYRNASWMLWRDHRVFVPFATIQNWVEAGGKKGE